ncbi:unnamed protein product [Schistosoma mattheei]|uniref:Uncharacterized protein n=1 Tax=Schistosoma mattheei TaxID=31246 RepID=A0A183PYJ0_9TREM|nr:unnamed protein product [Schistosoma mattheei]
MDLYGKREQDSRKEEQKRTDKVNAQDEYTKANRQVKKSIGDDKKQHVRDVTITGGRAAREGNMKQLYDSTKKLAGRYSK